MDKITHGIQGAVNRAITFVDANAATLGDAVESLSLARLRELDKAFTDAGATQYAAMQAAKARTRLKSDCAERLRSGFLVPASRVAHAHLEEIPVPKLIKFAVPAAKASDAQLAVAARAMVDVTEEYRQVFRDERLSEDFIERFRTAIAEFDAERAARDGEVVKTRQTTRSIGRLVRTTRSLLAVVSGLVEERLAARPELIDAWHATIRVPRTRRANSARTEAVTAPAAAPAPSLNAA